MWTLKEDIQIVINDRVNDFKLIIDRTILKKNPELALMVMNNPTYKDKWGHNFVEVGEPKPKQPVKSIPVEIKKKQETELPLTKSPDTASTSQTAQSHNSAKEAQPDGMTLKVSDQKRQFLSTDSPPPKPATGSQSSQKRS